MSAGGLYKNDHSKAILMHWFWRIQADASKTLWWHPSPTYQKASVCYDLGGTNKILAKCCSQWNARLKLPTVQRLEGRLLTRKLNAIMHHRAHLIERILEHRFYYFEFDLSRRSFLNVFASCDHMRRACFGWNPHLDRTLQSALFGSERIDDRVFCLDCSSMAVERLF